jgi:hypothetical protein
VMRWASTLVKSLLIDRFFTVIALSHRHNVPRRAARRPNYHHHSIGKKSDCLITYFAIVPADVLHSDRWTGKDDGGVSEIQTPLVESRLTLCRIGRDLHAIKCTPIK